MENNKVKLLIAIPSKNRLEVLKKNALNWVGEVGYDFKIFVEPQDSQYDCLKNVVYLKENNRGLGYSKSQIKEYAIANGYTHIFKVDDDVRGFTKFRQILKEDEMLEWIKKVIISSANAFADQRVGAIGFPYRFEMYEKEGWTVTKRLQTAYIVPTEFFHADEKVSVFEDFAQGLTVLTKGRLILKYGMAGIDMGVGVGKGSGGHQSFDRKRQALSELDILRTIYPPLNFRKVDKPWGIEPDLSSVHLGEKIK